MNKILKRFIAIIIVCSTVVTSMVSAYATTNEFVDTEQPTIIQGDGYISENYNLFINGKKISVSRVSYSNNSSIWCVDEDGIKTSWVVKSDYAQIQKNLFIEKNIKQYGSGYQYVYITTKSDTQHLTPRNGSYSAILSAVSLALGLISAPAGLAVGIAALIFDLNSSSVECWITNTRAFFEVHDASGSYLGYYKMNYTIVTEAMVNGKRQRIDTQSGSADSFYIF